MGKVCKGNSLRVLGQDESLDGLVIVCVWWFRFWFWGGTAHRFDGREVMARVWMFCVTSVE